MLCKCCNKEIHSKGFFTHIKYQHNISSNQEYYDKFIKCEGEGRCKTCGVQTKFGTIITGYQKFCCAKCAQNNSETRKKIEVTCLNRFGAPCTFQSDKIKQKIAKTNLKRYGAENVYASNYGKQKCKSAWKLHYGVNNPGQAKEVKRKNRQHFLDTLGVESPFASKSVQEKLNNTFLKKYGVLRYTQTNKCKKYMRDLWQTDSYKEKQYATRKKNKSFNSSKSEKELELTLKERFYNVKTQYKSCVYPFLCDFYIPELDLYIECNFHWTHGGHFFSADNQEDIEKLSIWKEKSKTSKFYKNAIHTWTVRDLNKRRIAKENNLNYTVLWNVNDISNFLDGLDDIKHSSPSGCTLVHSGA